MMIYISILFKSRQLLRLTRRQLDKDTSFIPGTLYAINLGHEYLDHKEVKDYV